MGTSTARLSSSSSSSSDSRLAMNTSASASATSVTMPRSLSLYGSVSPIVDIAVMFTDTRDQNRADQPPPFYRALQRTVTGKLANLNHRSGGRDIYLCYLRQSDAPPEKRHLRPITGLCVVHTDRGEMAPEGYEVITKTVSNQMANLNAGSGGRHIYLCVQRQEGAPPLLDLAISMSRFKRKVKPPEGFAMLAHTAGGASGDLNAGSRGHFVCLCCRYAPWY
mmetsp:Transcript_32595/g.81700  ORF Transcript_32595/g.81700 Transcript_32595/m.81700 type:complete len:222 (-) Transcript_32595:34-699(-)